MTTRVSRCPFDVEIGSDVRPGDDLHSIAAIYTFEFYRSKAEDPEAPEVDLGERHWRVKMLSDAARCAQLADDLMRDSVARVRDAGGTWEEIGRALGITKQAAQQRFGGGK